MSAAHTPEARAAAGFDETLREVTSQLATLTALVGSLEQAHRTELQVASAKSCGSPWPLCGGANSCREPGGGEVGEVSDITFSTSLLRERDGPAPRELLPKACEGGLGPLLLDNGPNGREVFSKVGEAGRPSAGALVADRRAEYELPTSPTAVEAAEKSEGEDGGISRADQMVHSRACHTLTLDSLKEVLVGGTEDSADLSATLRLGSSDDPNMDLGAFSLCGQRFTAGTPLAVAVMKGQKGWARLLLEAKADPNGTYSFEAGARKASWECPLVHATKFSGDVEMLRLLVDAGSDWSATCTSGAGLLWQASWYNQEGLVAHLLELKADTEQMGEHADQSGRSLTALHLSCELGHLQVVRRLLGARAQLHTGCGTGRRPLDDAILQGNHAVVRELVIARADLFATGRSDTSQEGKHALAEVDTLPTLPRSPSDGSETWGLSLRPPSPVGRDQAELSTVFRQNPFMAATTAQAMQVAPELAEQLSCRDVEYFLNLPGEAPIEIMKAIVRGPVQVSYWETSAHGQDAPFRRTMSSGYITDIGPQALRAATGPPVWEMQRLFDENIPLPARHMEMVDRLAPQVQGDESEMLWPLDVYVCVVPGVHEDLKVLRAIHDCGNKQIFKEPLCEAIMHAKGSAGLRFSLFRVSTALLEALNLTFINVINGIPRFWAKNVGEDGMMAYEHLLVVACWIAITVLSWSILMQFFKAIGYFAKGLYSSWLLSGRVWVDNFVTISTAWLLWRTFQLGLEAPEDASYGAVMGTTVFLKWLRCLFTLSIVRRIGMGILPIISVMWDIGPFLFVLMVCLIGATNMYYALALYDFHSSFFLIYRVVVLGDMDFYEWEKSEASFLDDHIHRTPNYWVVRCFVVIVSFSIGLALMNIFIAVLSVAYDKACTAAEVEYARFRYTLVLNEDAVMRGMTAVWDFCSCRRRRRRQERKSRGCLWFTMPRVSAKAA